MVTLPEAQRLSDGEGVRGVKEALMGKLRRGVEGLPGGGSKSGLSYQLGDRQAGESLALQGPKGLMEVCVEVCVLVNPWRRQSVVPPS